MGIPIHYYHYYSLIPSLPLANYLSKSQRQHYWIGNRKSHTFNLNVIEIYYVS